MSVNQQISNELNNDNKKRNKQTKLERYENERKIFIQELSDILELDNKEYIIMHDIEKNNTLKKKIDEQKNNIKKYYKCGTWRYFILERTNSNDSTNIVSLIKQLFENSGYKIFSKQKVIEGYEKKVTVYYFNKT